VIARATTARPISGIASSSEATKAVTMALAATPAAAHPRNKIPAAGKQANGLPEIPRLLQRPATAVCPTQQRVSKVGVKFTIGHAFVCQAKYMLSDCCQLCLYQSLSVR